jgi:hypothetical protein
VPVRGARGDAQDFGRLVPRQAREVAQLDQAGLQRVAPGELGEGRVQGQERLVRLGCGREVRVQLLTLPAAAVFEPPLAPGVLDQDTPHRFGGGGEEVFPGVPVLRVVHAGQAQVGFVDQRRGVEGLARLLLRQLLGGQPAQLVVDQRQELLGGVGVALLDGG